MKCKPYSEITVEIGTQLKTVKITLNIFAVWFIVLCRLFPMWPIFALLLFFQMVIEILDHSGYAWLVCVILLGVTEFLFAHLSKPFNLYTM